MDGRQNKLRKDKIKKTRKENEECWNEGLTEELKYRMKG